MQAMRGSYIEFATHLFHFLFISSRPQPHKIGHARQFEGQRVREGMRRGGIGEQAKQALSWQGKGKGNVLRVYSVQPRASRWMDGWMRLKVYDSTLGQSRGLAG